MGKFGTPGKRCNSFLQKICIKGLQNFALVKENKRLFLEGVLWFPTLHETGMVLDFEKELKQSFIYHTRVMKSYVNKRDCVFIKLHKQTRFEHNGDLRSINIVQTQSLHVLSYFQYSDRLKRL